MQYYYLERDGYIITNLLTHGSAYGSYYADAIPEKPGYYYISRFPRTCSAIFRPITDICFAKVNTCESCAKKLICTLSSENNESAWGPERNEAIKNGVKGESYSLSPSKKHLVQEGTFDVDAFKTNRNLKRLTEEQWLAIA